MNDFGLMAGIEGGGEIDAIRPDIFSPIKDDADLMTRIEEPSGRITRAIPRLRRALTAIFFRTRREKVSHKPITQV